MKLLVAEATNFGSYTTLNIDFLNQGLSLVYGPTGSGKSTFQDLAPWILYGITAKDGNADDIRSWNAPDEPTTGIIRLVVSDKDITVTRIRGKASQNDLYWQEDGFDDLHRGKDITETQKLLEERLGVSADLYLSAAYYNEFSPTGTFFTNKAKDRRELFEKIASLDLPVRLAEGVTNDKKQTKKELVEKQGTLAKLSGKLEQLRASILDLEARGLRWHTTHADKLKELAYKRDDFEQEKARKIQVLETGAYTHEKTRNDKIDILVARLEKLDLKIDNLEDKCPTCGRSDKHAEHKMQVYKFEEAKKQLIDLQDQNNPYLSQIQDVQKSQNIYVGLLAEEIKRVNPFMSQKDDIISTITSVESRISAVESAIKSTESRLSALSQLYDLSFELRGILLKKAVKAAEVETNRYLDKYFDNEIHVAFNLKDSDNLEVSIQKNSHECVYRQLSKGQRGLLKLCFSLAIMRASANKAGVHFSTLFFDEALDGLDADLKNKAFNLFCELETRHETIYLIDHNIDFQNLFSRKLRVTIDGDASNIYEE